jgi:hypothetical protein
MTTTEVSAQVEVAGKVLGKLSPKYDARTLRLATYIEKRRVPKVPQTHNLSRKTRKAFPDLGMMRNDALGCCTVSALGHAFQGWTVFGKKPWRPADEDIVNAYNRINGGVDQGAYMLDALNTARREGIGGNKIHAFVAVDPLNHDQVRTAHFLFGGLYFGASLPRNAQVQKVWDLVPGNGSEPGSWGGHAMNLFDTGAKVLRAATWGGVQDLTWAWWDRYVDECYAVLEEDFVGDDRRSPQGFSLKRLDEDLRAL